MMKRKEFFSALSLGILGIAFTGFSTLKLFGKHRKMSKKVDVKINPLAIKRNETKAKNV